MKEFELFFISIIPPEPLHSFAKRQKEYFKDKYNSKAALRSPPHITLHMPFRIKGNKIDFLLESLKELAEQHVRFDLSCNGFGAFEPRVIYLNISRPDELLKLQKGVGQVMKQKMNHFNANYKDQVFNPHLTVAFRDLKKPLFYKAWEEFKNKEYSSSFSTDSFTLLKHDGLKWEVFESFELKKD